MLIDPRFHILDRILSIASADREIATILRDSLCVLVEEMPTCLGGACLVQFHDQAEPLVKEYGVVGDAAAHLVREHWARALRDKDSDRQGRSPLDSAKGGAPVVSDTDSAVLLRLRPRDQDIGLLTLIFENPAGPRSLTAESCETMGRAIGLALDNARLYADAHQTLRRSQALYKVSRALSSTLDLDHLLSLIVSLAVDTIDRASNGVLHLYDPETRELRPRALSFQPGVLPDTPGKHGMHLGRGVAGLALQTGRLINVPDVAQDSRFLQSATSRRFATMAVAPIMLGDRRIGTLSIDSPSKHAFTEDDEHLLATLATMAAAAIDNARLVTDLQQSLDDLKTTQEHLIQSARLSAVGQLISGVAHELNNPLTAIMGYAQLLRQSHDQDNELARDLDKIQAQAKRASEIVQNLLTFARRRKQQDGVVDVSEALRRTLDLKAYQIRRAGIRITTNLQQDLPNVEAASDHLRQVFLHLINNALDAMENVTGARELVLSTEHLANMVRVTISDTGPGLSPEAKKHLFEPFSTTKDVGEGTGLGLAICFGIVRQYGGRIYTTEGQTQGATFVVELPVAGAQIVDDQQPTGQTPYGEIPRRRLILVVEDEDEVSGLIVAMLEEQGHRTAVARDAQAALDRVSEAKAAGKAYDLVISDVNLPGLRGPDLYQRLCAIDPHYTRRLVLITGDALDPGTEEFVRAFGLAYLQKPFSIDSLQSLVSGALRASQELDAREVADSTFLTNTTWGPASS